MKDIYFEKNYGKLNESIEDGVSEIFEYNNNFGRIQHMFIKREIPIFIEGRKYFDLVTPYGYGGPLITQCEKGYEFELVNGFSRKFQQYCENNNIVSEFVRFHPIVENVKHFKGCYDVTHIRNTVVTNLEKHEDPFQYEFSKSCRKNIRKALRQGLTYKVTKNPSDVSRFKEIYYSTMKRNNAIDYYYFNDEYFNKSVELLQDNLLLVESIYEGQPIAMGLYFIYGDTIHIHLSGTLNEYLYLSPAYILRYGVTKWGKENGYNLIHHGGGRTNDANDTLYKFKKQFGNITDREFYVGKKIWDKSIYEKLCKVKNITYAVDFFPAYRFE